MSGRSAPPMAIIMALLCITIVILCVNRCGGAPSGASTQSVLIARYQLPNSAYHITEEINDNGAYVTFVWKTNHCVLMVTSNDRSLTCR